MTREGVEIIKGAMRAISEQCMRTDSCKNCPFSCCCQCIDYSHETRPDNWFREVVQMTVSEYFKLQAKLLEWEADTREVLGVIAGVKIGESGART